MFGVGGAGFTAQLNAANPPIKLPSDYWPMTLFDWLSNSSNMLAVITAAAAMVGAVAAFKQLFIDKPAATRDEVADIVINVADGTNVLVDEVGGQVFLADQASVERDAKLLSEIEALKQLLLAQNPAGAQQVESFVTTATDLAGSESAEDRSIAREAVEGDPLAASDRLMAEVEVGVAEQAERARQAARIAAPFSVAKAITAYARAVELDPSDFWTWIELSRLHHAAGSLPQARQTAEAALQHVGGDWDRMIAEETLGDIAVDEGQLPAAHRHYQARLAASQAILAAAPDDNDRQREVSVSHERLGDVAVAQGDLAGARAAYGAGLVIRERLAATDPGNAGWQRDLSVSHNKLGDVAVAQGDLAGARMAYGAGLAIAERLAASDPGNAGWQRDLSVSHNKLGDVAVAQGDLAGARAAYGAGLVIRESLAASDPGNAGWQRDLSVSHEKLGDLAEMQEDYAEAVRCYEASLPIARRLAETLPDHPGFENDFAITQRRIAQLCARLRGD